LKYLRNKGLRPEEVLTRISSKQAANIRGSWSVATFELADDRPVLGKKPPEEPSPANAENIPSEWV